MTDVSANFVTVNHAEIYFFEEPVCQLQCANGLQLPCRNQTCAGRFKYQLQENHNQPCNVSRRRRKRVDGLIKAGCLLCVKGCVIFKFSKQENTTSQEADRVIYPFSK